MFFFFFFSLMSSDVTRSIYFVPGRFGPESFRPWVVSALVDSAWVVSALDRFGHFWWRVFSLIFSRCLLVRYDRLKMIWLFDEV